MPGEVAATRGAVRARIPCDVKRNPTMCSDDRPRNTDATRGCPCRGLALELQCTRGVLDEGPRACGDRVDNTNDLDDAYNVELWLALAEDEVIEPVKALSLGMNAARRVFSNDAVHDQQYRINTGMVSSSEEEGSGNYNSLAPIAEDWHTNAITTCSAGASLRQAIPMHVLSVQVPGGMPRGIPGGLPWGIRQRQGE